MRLSEAIRLGAMLKPQGRGAMLLNGRTCAIGAALDAIGQLECASELKLPTEWAWCRNMATALRCPACRKHQRMDIPIAMIGHLNDRHRWTRERIADWVATVEPSVVRDDECAGAEMQLAACD